MGERITLELPSELAERVRVAAARSRRRFEDVLVDWIDRGSSEPEVESLPDDKLLALCDSEMAADRQEELSDLLERNREGLLSETDRSRVDELMRTYRLGLGAQGSGVKNGRGARVETAADLTWCVSTSQWRLPGGSAKRQATAAATVLARNTWSWLACKSSTSSPVPGWAYRGGQPLAELPAMQRPQERSDSGPGSGHRRDSSSL